jgi:hypothetical protein
MRVAVNNCSGCICALCASARQNVFVRSERGWLQLNEKLVRIAGRFFEASVKLTKAKGMCSRRVAESAKKILQLSEPLLLRELR